MIDAAFASLDPGMNDVLGSETATLRRVLRLGRPDGSPALAVEVAQAAAAGASTVRLKNAGAGRLAGYVGAGLLVTIGGEEYAVARDCPANPADGTVLLALVTPLLAAADEDDAVAVEEAHDFDLLHCLAYSPRWSVLSGELAGAVSFALSVPLAQEQLPRLDDILTCSLGMGVVLGFLPGDGGSKEALVGRPGTSPTQRPAVALPPTQRYS